MIPSSSRGVPHKRKPLPADLIPAPGSPAARRWWRAVICFARFPATMPSRQTGHGEWFGGGELAART